MFMNILCRRALLLLFISASACNHDSDATSELPGCRTWASDPMSKQGYESRTTITQGVYGYTAECGDMCTMAEPLCDFKSATIDAFKMPQAIEADNLFTPVASAKSADKGFFAIELADGEYALCEHFASPPYGRDILGGIATGENQLGSGGQCVKVTIQASQKLGYIRTTGFTRSWSAL